MSEKTFEHSAGGLIVDDGRILLIRMRNLEGAMVWTFPKGHLEAGEGPREAARREVAEETGLDCEIIRELYKAEYSFSRNGRPVEKDVIWYLMRRVGGDGVIKTPDEIFGIKWCAPDDAAKCLSYESDIKMLGLLKETR